MRSFYVGGILSIHVLNRRFSLYSIERDGRKEEGQTEKRGLFLLLLGGRKEKGRNGRTWCLTGEQTVQTTFNLPLEEEHWSRGRKKGEGNTDLKDRPQVITILCPRKNTELLLMLVFHDPLHCQPFCSIPMVERNWNPTLPSPTLYCGREGWGTGTVCLPQAVLPSAMYALCHYLYLPGREESGWRTYLEHYQLDLFDCQLPAPRHRLL